MSEVVLGNVIAISEPEFNFFKVTESPAFVPELKPASIIFVGLLVLALSEAELVLKLSILSETKILLSKSLK